MSALSKEIRSFVVIAKEQSVRKAAEMLNISASALSRQMSILEEDFGTTLLTRLPRGIELTEQGQALFKQAQHWINEENRLRRSIKEEHNDQLVQLRIGAMECFNSKVLPDIHARLSAHFGSLRVHFITGSTQMLLSMLAEHQLDFVIAFNVQKNDKIKVLSRKSCQLGLVHRPGLLEQELNSISLHDTLQWPLCMPGTELSIHTRLYTEILKQNVSFDIAATSNSVELLSRLVLQGTGVTYLTRYDVELLTDLGMLAFTPLTDKRLTEELCICISATARVDPVTACIQGVMAEALKMDEEGQG